MKNLRLQIIPILVLLVIFQINPIKAQWQWSDPSAITDDPDWNHRNVDLIPMGSNSTWIAYERYSDTSATSIYIKEILNGSEPIEIIGGGSNHFRNPKFYYDYSFNQTDTSFFLFYETSDNGNKDLNYIAYLNNGEILGPFSFFTTNGDEHSIEMSYFNPRLTWISNGNLMWSKYEYQNGSYVFSDPIVLDSGNCISPKMAGTDIFYIKQTDSTSYIYKYGSESNSKEIIFNSGYAVNLDKDGLGMPYLTWSAEVDSLWYLWTWGQWSNLSLHYEYKTTSYDPAILSFQIGVKSSSLMGEFYLAFPWDIEGNQEILMNLEVGSDDFVNISSSETINQNPRSFYGEQNGFDCFYGYMTWESLQNGRWQLYHSKILQCIGAVDENESDNTFMKISPNPVSGNLTIAYFLENRSKVRIDILDIYGKIVSTVTNNFQNAGEQSINWKIEQSLNPAVYVVLLRRDNEIYSQKIIKSH